jgi:hypothetical protein
MDRQRRAGWAAYYSEIRERYRALDLVRQMHRDPLVGPVIPAHIAEQYKQLKTKYDAEGSECSICQEPTTFDASFLTNCGHLFHRACIDAWKEKQPDGICPTCRGKYAEAGKHAEP